MTTSRTCRLLLQLAKDVENEKEEASDESKSEEKEEGKSSRKQRPVYLKDYERQVLLAMSHGYSAILASYASLSASQR